MLERFRYYVLVDHRTRWRNDIISTAISVAWYLVSIAAGVPNAEAVKVSIEFLIVSVAIFTVWYSVVPQTSPVLINVSKRTFLPRIAFVGLGVLVLAIAGIGTPALEAAILDKRLRGLLKDELTQDRIEEAAQIVSDANDHNLHASPQLISELGQKVLNSSAKPHLRGLALAAACVFASYRSSLSPPPLTGLASSELFGTILVKCGNELNGGEPAVLSGVPWLKEGPKGFLCSRAFVQPLQPANTQAQLPLNGLHARNITFVDGTFFYGGGSLNLESVQFVDSRFQVPLAYAGNQNVQRFISAILTGQPITLEID